MKPIAIVTASFCLISSALGQVEAGATSRELAFQPNLGQAPGEFEFVARGSEYALSLSRERAVLGVVDDQCGELAITLELVGVRDGERGEVGDTLPTRFGYFLGNDPAQWQPNVPSFADVRYREVWAGVDVVYLAAEGRLQYDFHVAPQADPSAIELDFGGVERMALLDDGSLELLTSFGRIVQPAPTLYQERDGERELVEGRFELRGEHTLGFAIDQWDRERALVIDPEVVWQSLIGSPGTDHATVVRAASDGTLWLVGNTDNALFPRAGLGVSFLFQGSADVFVSQLDSTGTTLLFSALIGGGFDDEATSAVLVSDTEIVVCGFTYSGDFPALTVTKATPLQATLAGDTDAFVFRLDDQGVLTFSTFLGGSARDEATGVGLLAGDHVAVCGFTASQDFPVQSAPQPTNGGSAGTNDGFVCRIGATGEAFSWSTYAGGAGADSFNDLAVDPFDDSIVAVGASSSTDVQIHARRYALAGTLSNQLTFGNAAHSDEATSVAIAADRSVIVGVTTDDANFPTIEAPAGHDVGQGSVEAVVCAWDPTLATLNFAAYVSGSASDRCEDIVARDGRVIALTSTVSDDIPLVQSMGSATTATYRAHVASFDLAQSPAALDWSSYLPAAETCQPFSLDAEGVPNGALFIAGYYVSTSVDGGAPDVFPPTSLGGIGTNFFADAFVLRIDPALSSGTPVVGFSDAGASASAGEVVRFHVYRWGGSDSAFTIDYDVSSLGTPLPALGGALSFAAGQQIAEGALTLNGLPSGTMYLAITLDDTKSTATADPESSVMTVMVDTTPPYYPPSDEGDEDCCGIATVSRGSSMERDLDLLRGVRDNLLSRFGAGRAFTHWYYRGLSPTVVRFLDAHPAALPFARASLWCVLFAVGHPIELVAVLLVLAMIRWHRRIASTRPILVLAN